MERQGCYIDFEPIGRRVACRPAVDLLTLAREAGISIAAVCGGKGTCGRCRVISWKAMSRRCPLPSGALLKGGR